MSKDGKKYTFPLYAFLWPKEMLKNIADLDSNNSLNIYAIQEFEKSTEWLIKLVLISIIVLYFADAGWEFISIWFLISCCMVYSSIRTTYKKAYVPYIQGELKKYEFIKTTTYSSSKYIAYFIGVGSQSKNTMKFRWPKSVIICLNDKYSKGDEVDLYVARNGYGMPHISDAMEK